MNMLHCTLLFFFQSAACSKYVVSKGTSAGPIVLCASLARTSRPNIDFDILNILIANVRRSPRAQVPPTMSSQLPLRSIRIPALQRRCLFQRHQILLRSAQPAITHPSSRRTFSSTPSRPKKRSQFGQDKAQTRAAAEAQVAPSPKVNFDRAQRDADAMAEDIGILQNTIVRATFKDLWQETDGLRDIMRYYWNLVKHKGTALYS
jgi:hypothetical protein